MNSLTALDIVKWILLGCTLYIHIHMHYNIQYVCLFMTECCLFPISCFNQLFYRQEIWYTLWRGSMSFGRGKNKWSPCRMMMNHLLILARCQKHEHTHDTHTYTHILTHQVMEKYCLICNLYLEKAVSSYFMHRQSNSIQWYWCSIVIKKRVDLWKKYKIYLHRNALQLKKTHQRKNTFTG